MKLPENTYDLSNIPAAWEYLAKPGDYIMLQNHKCAMQRRFGKHHYYFASEYRYYGWAFTCDGFEFIILTGKRGTSYEVDIKYDQPFPSWRKLRRAAMKFLKAVRQDMPQWQSYSVPRTDRLPCGIYLGRIIASASAARHNRTQGKKL